jgi:hypothetical protein
MLTVTYAECHIKPSHAECRYAECRYAECRGAKRGIGMMLGHIRWSRS